jgi:Holliday junction DNA helicase RuvA
MINAVIGDIVSVKDQTVVIRAGQIEFSLIISGQTEARLCALVGDDRNDVRVLTVLSHHQDSMLLYGFFDEMEREAFNQLQTVGGIGPKQALKILSGITVPNLAAALDAGNLKLLSSIPGIGPKTGQKMILQLRNVLVLDEEKELKESKQNVKFREVVSGLVDMGYDRRVVEEMVSRVENEQKGALEKLSLHDQEQLVFKQALRYLG